MKIYMSLAAALLAAGPAFANGANHDDHAYDDRFREHPDTRRTSSALDRYYGYGTYLSLFDRDFRWPERLERDRDGSLSYDRDYPYEFRYRAVRTGVAVTAPNDGLPMLDREPELDAPVRVHRGKSVAVRTYRRD